MSRPSERVLLAVVLAAAAAVAIGWVVFLISRAGVAPVVLLPIAVGLAIGLAQAAIFDRLQAPLSWPAAAGLGLLFGALAVVTQDYSGYRDYRAEQARSSKEIPKRRPPRQQPAMPGSRSALRPTSRHSSTASRSGGRSTPCSRRWPPP